MSDSEELTVEIDPEDSEALTEEDEEDESSDDDDTSEPLSEAQSDEDEEEITTHIIEPIKVGKGKKSHILDTGMTSGFMNYPNYADILIKKLPETVLELNIKRGMFQENFLSRCGFDFLSKIDTQSNFVGLLGDAESRIKDGDDEWKDI